MRDVRSVRLQADLRPAGRSLLATIAVDTTFERRQHAPQTWEGTMANPVIKGLHHITLCASGAQEDIDFCTQVLGQRLIKQTVLFDGRYAHYHLYYANANAEVGSVTTTFPYKRVPGRQGSGQISSTAYTAPKGAVKFWKEHLDRHKVEHSGILERFGQPF